MFLSPSRQKNPFSKVAHEILRLTWLCVALYLLLALSSYSSNDASLNTWSSQKELHNWMGRTGSILADLCFQSIGMGGFLLVGLFVFFAWMKNNSVPKKLKFLVLVPSVCFFLESTTPTFLRNMSAIHPGGTLGKLLVEISVYLTGPTGTLLFSWFLLGISLVFCFEKEIVTDSAAWLWAKLTTKREKAEKPAAAAASSSVYESISLVPPPISVVGKPAVKTEQTQYPTPTVIDKDEEISRLTGPKTVKSAAAYKPPKQTGEFRLPSLDMLSGRAESKQKTVDKSWYLEKAEILVQKLKDFGVDGEIVHISPGPVITVYEFKPASGVKIKEIANLSDDLTLALSVLSVRIVAPIPGKPVVGIEIPSPHRETVFLKDLIQETPFYGEEYKIPIALGRLASGEAAVAGLASMPHLLVAGSTGTGKSVFINALINSLLYRYTPKQLKLILVDPKMVELSLYEGIPHLLLPVVVDSKKAAMALRWAVEEMEKRYSLMHKLGVRHIDGYNEKLTENPKLAAEDAPTFLPYIVVIIDEYADLMAVVPKDVELSITRLAQKARASGIHLVLATQRPSTDVVTGTIKANFPSRLSFRVASSIDSKTILDRTGSERLLGNGDMLFHSAGFTTLKRLQGAYISDQDVANIVTFLKSQGEPEYDERLLAYQEDADRLGEGSEDSSGSGSENNSALYDSAVRLVTEKGEASISLVQRHLKIGYNRAASLIEQMEKDGVVGQATGASKRRPVLAGSI